MSLVLYYQHYVILVLVLIYYYNHEKIIVASLFFFILFLFVSAQYCPLIVLYCVIVSLHSLNLNDDYSKNSKKQKYKNWKMNAILLQVQIVSGTELQYFIVVKDSLQYSQLTGKGQRVVSKEGTQEDTTVAFTFYYYIDSCYDDLTNTPEQFPAVIVQL